MNLKSLLASFALVAVTSTAALAKPAQYTAQAEAGFSVDAAFSIGGVTVRDHRDHRDDRPVVRDHRSERPVVRGRGFWPKHSWQLPRPIETNNTKLYTNPNGQSWSEYTGPIHNRNHYGYGFSAITDATRIAEARQDFWLKGALTNQIQLRAVAGSTFVTSVLVEFGPGTTPQVVHVNRDLREGAITIDLSGHTRPVYRIAVGGTSGQRSAYQIFAR